MRTLKIGVVILLLLNLTGCWSSKVELDELTFVYGLFIDVGKEAGTVEITINSPLPNRLNSGSQPSSGGGDGNSYSTVSKTADTIADAMLLVQKDLTRQLSLSQLKIIVLGKAYAEQGIGELLLWIRREPSLPLGTYVMASPGSAKEMNTLTPIYEQLPSDVLRSFGTEKYMFSTTIKDCIFAEASGVGFAINNLSFGKKEETTKEGKPQYWAGIQGAMLFQNEKMKGILKLKEGRALAWAAGKLKLSVYSVTWDGGESAASVVFVSTKSSKKVKIRDKGPVFTVKLKGKASVIYLRDPKKRNLEEISNIITEKLSDKVTANLTEAIHLSQKAGADVLQLGMLLEWNDPKLWKQLRERWDNYYAHEADIKVKTDFRIVDFGTAK
ncbi:MULTISPECIES: Ger(x)C family spore germination protein [unclassified Paenibacillus]|uniref:Ger(x)C family spore germination protein n=1 Tax=unclassified Paenibacillus TaxID=185978 RepID=UPI002474EBF4|nr:MULTISPECIES: Ger(x)C family spore germination protein [unclassified Paenibacillus]MDH6427161.1 spore germination protein KC [Paenibacillus sp. PastH-4]MDH6443190.1 spore germination protein KC [Paenibacillus sp. PastF-4]MDH6526105.1 spore germination protein KC [Paenibacillus sp. PastH-3]